MTRLKNTLLVVAAPFLVGCAETIAAANKDEDPYGVAAIALSACLGTAAIIWSLNQ